MLLACNRVTAWLSRPGMTVAINGTGHIATDWSYELLHRCPTCWLYRVFASAHAFYTMTVVALSHQVNAMFVAQTMARPANLHTRCWFGMNICHADHHNQLE